MTTAHMRPEAEQPACPADWEIIADDGATPEQRQDAWQRVEAALAAGRDKLFAGSHVRTGGRVPG